MFLPTRFLVGADYAPYCDGFGRASRPRYRQLRPALGQRCVRVVYSRNPGARVNPAMILAPCTRIESNTPGRLTRARMGNRRLCTAPWGQGRWNNEYTS